LSTSGPGLTSGPGATPGSLQTQRGGPPSRNRSARGKKEQQATEQHKSLIPPWSFGRLALSQQSCRFELPMDMTALETMSPQDYLRRHCMVSSNRLELYHRTFLQHRVKAHGERGTGLVPYTNLEKCLRGVLVNTITTEEAEKLISMIEVTEDTKIDIELFCGIAALAERMLYPKFITYDTQDMKDHKKDKIECADFCALEWKFNGVKINPPIRKILETL